MYLITTFTQFATLQHCKKTLLFAESFCLSVLTVLTQTKCAVEFIFEILFCLAFISVVLRASACIFNCLLSVLPL